jgi:hypothetical protein
MQIPVSGHAEKKTGLFSATEWPKRKKVLIAQDSFSPQKKRN